MLTNQHPVTEQHTTIDATMMIAALRNIRPGERLVYYTGFLARDRDRADVAAVAKVAEGLRQAGTIVLLQRKLRVFAYEYIAARPRRGESP